MNQKILNKIKDYIDILPNVEKGQPILKGTRLPVKFILNQLTLGWNIKDIKKRYPEVNYRHLVKIISLLSDGINTIEHDQEEAHYTWYSRYRCQSSSTI